MMRNPETSEEHAYPAIPRPATGEADRLDRAPRPATGGPALPDDDEAFAPTIVRGRE
jgi:hypothetical protein